MTGREGKVEMDTSGAALYTFAFTTGATEPVTIKLHGYRLEFIARKPWYRRLWDRIACVKQDKREGEG